jgi:hypothetical protein
MRTAISVSTEHLDADVAEWCAELVGEHHKYGPQERRARPVRIENR